MALKDWKKWKGEKSWINKSKTVYIEIVTVNARKQTFGKYDNIFDVWVVKKPDKILFHDDYNSKSAALKAAKAYMRSH